MGVKSRAIAVSGAAVLVALLIPLGASGLAAEEFRALPLESLELESEHYKGLYETGGAASLALDDLFRILNLARSYQSYALYELAELWFLRLGNADVEGYYEDLVFNGLLVCAVGTGNWTRAEELLGVDSELSIEIESDPVLRLLKHLASNGKDEEALDLVDAMLARDKIHVPAEILNFKGSLLKKTQRIEEASYFYECLLNDLEVPSNLHPSVLGNKEKIREGAADTAFLLNDRIRARQHYIDLTFARDVEIRNWARFQIAQLDMLDNGYAEAESVFASLSVDSLWEPASSWAVFLREHSAAMKKHEAHIPDNRPSWGEMEP